MWELVQKTKETAGFPWSQFSAVHDFIKLSIELIS